MGNVVKLHGVIMDSKWNSQA